MITNPEQCLPTDLERLQAYAQILRILALDEPEALQRTIHTLEAEGARGDAASTALLAGSTLARAWLTSTGNPTDVATPENTTFVYPAHIGITVRGAGSDRAARRIAATSIGALLATDAPLVAMAGPLPAAPALHNVELWLGSPSGKDDVLVQEP
jgi:hypothetical protein